MSIQISHLRRWFAGGTIGLLLVVAAVYFYARTRVENALKEVPAKIGVEIQQSAKGFTVSRSEQGHTIFKIQASKAVQYKQGGRAELHDVTITLYGRDSSRFDQIYGADFEYDPQSGDVIGKGQVQMDLEANPEGIIHPDQATPRELKNPVHLTTTNLLFNQKTGNALTREKVEFSLPQANGSAVGLSYAANTTVLTLQSQVDVAFHGATPARLTAIHGTITKNPRVVELDLPRLQNGARHASADKGTIYLRPDNTVDRILASGNVRVESEDSGSAKVQSNQVELLMAEKQDTSAVRHFFGRCPHGEFGSAAHARERRAGRPEFHRKQCAEHRAQPGQREAGAASAAGVRRPAGAQDVEITASVIDFFVTGGRRLQRADTSGPAQIALRPAPDTGQQTLVTAGKFQARFDDLGQLASVHGAPDARIVSQDRGPARSRQHQRHA